MTTRKTLRLRWRPVGWLAVCWTLVPGVWAQVGGPVATAGVAGGVASEPPMEARAPLETKVFPLAEVKRGLQGVAYTVFEGVTAGADAGGDSGRVEGRAGPGQDMILARLHGDEAGVYGGGGGDEREPGVYRRAAGGGAELPDRAVQQGADCGDYADRADARGAGRRGGGIGRRGCGRRGRRVRRAGEMQAMETPLVFSGFSQEAVERFGDRFRALGLTPVAGLGGADARQEAAGAAGAGIGGERGAGAGGPVDGGDVHGDVCGSEAAAGVRASDYAVWAGVRCR